MRARLFPGVFALSLLFATNCLPSFPPEICGNNLDEDQDGFFDCFDLDCKEDPTCQIEICDNGIDDDADFAVDCDDADCAEDPACDPGGSEICDDGADNDGDLLADCDDPDCANDPACSLCGNGAIDGTEDCDGADLNGRGCTDLGFVAGSLACRADCSFDTSGCIDSLCGDGILDPGEVCDDGNTIPGDGCRADCTAEVCGDGVIDPNEDCDGADLAGQSCQSFGFEAGSLGCDAACSFDLTGCFDLFEICDDGADNDGDFLVDCQDPECAVNPTCALLEDCFNGADDDGDLLADCDDPDCAVNCSDSCAAPLLADVPSSQTGDTTGRPDTSSGSCQIGGAPDVVFLVTAPQSGALQLTLFSDDDLGVYVQLACGDASTELGCADADFGDDAVESLSVQVFAGENLFVFVDGFFENEEGPFVLDLAFAGGSTEDCGNGIDDDADLLADCDDPDCINDPACSQSGPEICDDGVDNDGDFLTDCDDLFDCFFDPACSSGGEICDNGQDDDGDGSVDCDDFFDCFFDPACLTLIEDCDNGFDDDFDFLADCDDPDCANDPAC